MLRSFLDLVTGKNNIIMTEKNVHIISSQSVTFVSTLKVRNAPNIEDEMTERRVLVHD